MMDTNGESMDRKKSKVTSTQGIICSISASLMKGLLQLFYFKKVIKKVLQTVTSLACNSG